jgi:cyclophilin family peptidyl-prolyl cis-trans isomerase
VIKKFMIQGGDITNNNGTGGASIYGRHFPDESHAIKHDRPFLLGSANRGPNTNNSGFYITSMFISIFFFTFVLFFSFFFFFTHPLLSPLSHPFLPPIVAAPAPWLDGRSVVFGEVVYGHDVVREIEHTQTNAMDTPIETITIIDCGIVNNKAV